MNNYVATIYGSKESNIHCLNVHIKAVDIEQATRIASKIRDLLDESYHVVLNSISPMVDGNHG